MFFAWPLVGTYLNDQVLRWRPKSVISRRIETFKMAPPASTFLKVYNCSARRPGIEGVEIVQTTFLSVLAEREVGRVRGGAQRGIDSVASRLSLI